jgi:hypothetical protein
MPLGFRGNVSSIEPEQSSRVRMITALSFDADAASQDAAELALLVTPSALCTRNMRPFNCSSATVWSKGTVRYWRVEFDDAREITEIIDARTARAT